MNPRKDVSFISNVSHSYPFIIPTHGKQTTSHTVVESDKVYPIPTLQSRPFMLEKPIQYTSPSFRPCCFYLWWGNILHRGLPRNKRTITQQFILKITLLIMKWIKHCHDLQWITYDFSSSFAPHSIHSHYTHSHELPLTLTLSYSNMACRKIPHEIPTGNGQGQGQGRPIETKGLQRQCLVWRQAHKTTCHHPSAWDDVKNLAGEICGCSASKMW